MYCLQWLLPLLLIPRPGNPILNLNQSLFMTLYFTALVLEKKPCSLCLTVFGLAVLLMCFGSYNCLFYDCSN